MLSTQESEILEWSVRSLANYLAIVTANGWLPFTNGQYMYHFPLAYWPALVNHLAVALASVGAVERKLYKRWYSFS